MTDLCYARTIGDVCEVVTKKPHGTMIGHLDRMGAHRMVQVLTEYLRATEPDTTRPCDTEAPC